MTLGFLGVGPMGCQTGLYLTTAYPIERARMMAAVITALNEVDEYCEVPYQSEVLCGMASNHDLVSAKSIAHVAANAMASGNN